MWISKNPEDTEAMERVAGFRIHPYRRGTQTQRRGAQAPRRRERQSVQKEAFDKLKGALATLQQDITALSSCADAADSVRMARDVWRAGSNGFVDEQDIEMAGDMTAFIEEAQSMLDADSKSPCGISGGAPEGEGAPAEEAPAEEAPAE